MRSPIAGIRTLVLPWGALTGQRIVLNGDTGVIQIYDASNNLVAQLDSAGIRALGTNGTIVSLTNQTPTIALVELTPPTVAGVTWDPALIAGDEDTTADHRPLLNLTSPTANLVGASELFSQIVLGGTGKTSTDTFVAVDATALTVDDSITGAADFAINGTSQGRGNRFATARATSLAVAAGTPQMILDAAVGFVWQAGRCYRVSFGGRMGTNTAGALAIFKLLRGTTLAASTAIDFGGFKTGAVGDLVPVTLSALIANPTGAPVTTTVQASLTSSVGTVTHDGGTMPRSLTIEDVGAVADFQSPGGGNPAYNTI